MFLLYSMFATVLYMTEQVYLFKVATVFSFFQGWIYYTEIVQQSAVYSYIISHQNIIIPLGVLLMLYKLLLSNIINAALLSIWFNLSHVGFYRKKDDSHYRVEFHEVAGHSDGNHDDHNHGNDDHGNTAHGNWGAHH